MKALLKTLLHAVIGAAGSGALAALGGKSAAEQLLLAVIGSAVTSAISAAAKSTVAKPETK